MTHLLEYLFAVGCERYAMEPISVCVMSNHYHAVLHDRDGQLPAFLQWFHTMVAKIVNARRGRWDRFWDARQTSVCLLGDPSKVVAEAAYVLTNPTAAGLVERSGDWPGFRSAPGACAAKQREIRRPRAFFASDGTFPKVVRLRYVVPSTHSSLTPPEFAKLLSDMVRAVEDEHRASVRSRGGSFLGVRGVKKQPWDSKPSTKAPRRVLSPRVAACDSDRRRGLLAMLAAFVRDHAAALEELREGWRDVYFPAGTWLLPHVYGIQVHPPPQAV